MSDYPLLPNTTQIPNVILDRWMPHLTDAELRIVLYVARRTYGFGKESDAISIKQMCDGITKKDGTALDEGTGLSRPAVTKACARLQEKKVLEKSRHHQEGAGDRASGYRLNLLRKPKERGKEGVNEINPGGKNSLPGGVNEKYPQNQVLQNQEKGTPNGVPKEGKPSSPPPKKKTVKKLSPEEAEERWENLCAEDPNGRALATLAQLLAEENKGGEVALTRAWRELGERYVEGRKKHDTISEEAWAFGFEEAISHTAPSIRYVLKTAKRYAPPSAAVRHLRPVPDRPRHEEESLASFRQIEREMGSKA